MNFVMEELTVDTRRLPADGGSGSTVRGGASLESFFGLRRS